MQRNLWILVHTGAGFTAGNRDSGVRLKIREAITWNNCTWPAATDSSRILAIILPMNRVIG